MQNTEGLILIDKPADITSHDVVARLRYHLGTKKIGHAGTLDPMATGLLVLGVGKATKLLTYASGLDKTYRARIRLGRSTHTDDAMGEFTSEPLSDEELAKITEADISSVIKQKLLGEIMQVPSSVSAIKVNGVRAYQKVRSGQEVELKARAVKIYDFKINGFSYHPGAIDVDALINCSAGTYIRALARDLGEELKVGAHLTSLLRTQIGPFSLTAANELPAKDRPRASELDNPLIEIRALNESAMKLLPYLEVDEAMARALSFGQWIKAPKASPPLLAALERGPGDLIAVVKRAEKNGELFLKPEVVFKQYPRL